jgi:hypothetical protein
MMAEDGTGGAVSAKWAARLGLPIRAGEGRGQALEHLPRTVDDGWKSEGDASRRGAG